MQNLRISCCPDDAPTQLDIIVHNIDEVTGVGGVMWSEAYAVVIESLPLLGTLSVNTSGQSAMQ